MHYELTLHIEYLLLRHDCVVVPGLGAFINVRQPARFDESRGVWLPMTREVRFNGSLTHDDGLLASSMARKNQVGFQEGRELLRNATAHMQRMLDTDGEVTVGQLGILQRHEGATVFVPMQTAERLANMLGFAEAPVRPARTEEAGKSGSEVVQNDAADEPEEITENRGRRFDTDRNYYIPVNKVFARAAACLLIVAVAALSLMIPSADRKKIDQASVLPVEKITEKFDQSDKSGLSDQSDKSDLTDLSDKSELSEQSEQSEQSEPSVCYHAIVATFATEAEAAQFIAQHSGCGYELQVVKGRTKVRVAAARAPERESLQRTIASEAFRNAFSEAWIWESE